MAYTNAFQLARAVLMDGTRRFGAHLVRRFEGPHLAPWILGVARDASRPRIDFPSGTSVAGFSVGRRGRIQTCDPWVIGRSQSRGWWSVSYVQVNGVPPSSVFHHVAVVRADYGLFCSQIRSQHSKLKAAAPQPPTAAHAAFSSMTDDPSATAASVRCEKFPPAGAAH